MSQDIRQIYLSIRIIVYTYSLKDFLCQIQKIEQDTQTPVKERLSQIKKIKIELDKVSTEIDNIKKEIKLLNTYNLN